LLGACGFVGWLVLSCSGSAFTSKPTGDAGAGGASGGNNTAATAGKPSGASSGAAGAPSDGGMPPGAAGSSGASSGNAGDASASGGAPQQGEGGDGGGSEPEPSIPTDALLYWFKADAGVEADVAGNVSRWLDQSGNGFHARQMNTAYQPKLTETDLLPRPVLAFDGSDDLLELPEFTRAFDAGLSLFAVAGRGDERSCSAVIELSRGSERDDIFLGHSGTALQFEILDDVHLAPEGSWPHGEVKLLEVLQSADPVQAAAELRVNGGVASSKAMPHPLSVERTANYIGRTLYLNCGPAFSGAIAEIIMYSRKLRSDERIGVETYLMEKWQLQATAGRRTPARSRLRAP
jgi:hypothetical protein